MVRAIRSPARSRARRALGLGLLSAALLTVAACESKPSYKMAAAPGGYPAGPRPDATDGAHNTEDYNHIVDNPFLTVAQNPLSTFAIDVDTASYSNVRRFLNEGKLPPKDAVRIEELVNYFTYDYPAPTGEHPVSVSPEVAPCPWDGNHLLARIGLQARRIDAAHLPPRNLVFLIDVSGSMNEPKKLPLLKEAFGLLVDQLTERDRVAVTVYAGQAGLVLPPTPGDRKGEIRAALGRLEAGGPTNGGAGIVQAYRVAREGFLPGGANRVILATDGDFNVGVSGQGELIRLIEEQRKAGVFLTVLGFGYGNLKDATLEQLADHGNGHYAYIDSLDEARKVFVEQGAALVTVAKDVKLQVEFNPNQVAGYRLIGYENRLLHAQDFRDDRKDAGDMGAGHTVTALYELVPAGRPVPAPGVAPLKYQKPAEPAAAADSGELCTVRLRYKEPDADTGRELAVPVRRGAADARPSDDFRFAAAVAAFGMLLRDSPYKGGATFEAVEASARAGLGRDPHGHRAEFLKLVRTAGSLAPGQRREAAARR
jgi:Ca-activated chloride channel family protein